MNINRYSAVTGDAGTDDNVYRPDQTHEPFEYENNQGRLTDDLEAIVSDTEVVTLKRIFLDERWSPQMRAISAGTILAIIIFAACLMLTMVVGLFKSLNAIDREYLRNHRGIQFSPISNEGDAFLFFNNGGNFMRLHYSNEMSDFFGRRYNSSKTKNTARNFVNCTKEFFANKDFAPNETHTCDVVQSVERQRTNLTCPNQDQFWGFTQYNKSLDPTNLHNFPDPCIFVGFQQPDNWPPKDVDITFLGIKCNISSTLPAPYSISPNYTVPLDLYMVLNGARLNEDDKSWSEYPVPGAVFRLTPNNGTINALSFDLECRLVLNGDNNNVQYNEIFSRTNFAGLTKVRKRVVLHKSGLHSG